MRLICPNCDAQYEVGDGVIPIAGRDVQCSNCGQTWFQTHPDAAPEVEEPDFERFDFSEPEPVPAPKPAPEAAPEAVAPSMTDVFAEPSAPPPAPPVPAVAQSAPPVPQAPPVDGPAARSAPPVAVADDAVISFIDPDDDPDLSGQEDAGVATTPRAANMQSVSSPPKGADQPDLRRRTLDEAVMSVLREEAEREAAARRGLAPSLAATEPSATEPAAAPAADAPPPLRRPVARDLSKPKPPPEIISAPGPDEAGGPDTADLIEPRESVLKSARRDLLPDIDQIKTGLGEAAERPRPNADGYNLELPKPRGGGFRRGFILVLALGLALLLIYALAPMITAQVPALEPALTMYVAQVDLGRLWLDGQLQHMVDMLKESPAPAPAP